MEGIFIPIGFFAAIVLILWVYYTNRNKERLALIEKGADAGLFKTKGNKFPSLKVGMFFIGIGIGILIGNIIAVSTSLEEPVAYFSMIFLFGGLSLIANHLMEKKKSESFDE